MHLCCPYVYGPFTSANLHQPDAWHGRNDLYPYAYTNPIRIPYAYALPHTRTNRDLHQSLNLATPLRVLPYLPYAYDQRTRFGHGTWNVLDVYAPMNVPLYAYGPAPYAYGLLPHHNSFSHQNADLLLSSSNLQQYLNTEFIPKQQQFIETQFYKHNTTTIHINTYITGSSQQFSRHIWQPYEGKEPSSSHVNSQYLEPIPPYLYCSPNLPRLGEDSSRCNNGVLCCSSSFNFHSFFLNFSSIHVFSKKKSIFTLVFN